MASGLFASGVPAKMPKFLLPLRIVIIVLSVVVLALAAFALSVFGSRAGYLGSYSGAPGLLIFVAVKTWLIYGILLFVEISMPRSFPRIAAAVAYALSIIFWLSAWAWAASVAALWLSTVCYDGTCVKPNSYAAKEGGALAASAGLGAIIWVLSIVNLFCMVRACVSDRPAVHQSEMGPVGMGGGYSSVEPNKEAQTLIYSTDPAASAAPYGQPPVEYPPQTAYDQQSIYDPQQPVYGQPQTAYGQQQQPLYGQPQPAYSHQTASY
ncbi:uncharacterized protein SPSK_05528 [Sporothrix schenckii 1099-18]|uniref:MARVEL domain-containing protein n=2 Tax=Sporothrix schenckii TaxID=29908 RepID=U7Q3S8_SPOS1|nr:uncharacterized protein SPSK_05528 [Sporothrix schenckii 1099-18]ERT02534.1 hypothetical protein HMPREF1624_00834 [Sporothrix schenckii ATCC 58251]KJR80178.1 hypothetical protein SPSK_05528 [Sporothrix schenckii 1099-18]